MRNQFNLQGSLAEMIGSFVLSFISLLAIFIVKSEKSGLDTKWKKRGFLAIVVPSAVVIGLAASRGLGGHGQINPAVTMLVAMGGFQMGHEFAAIETVGTIGFQFIGGAIAFGVFILAIYAWKRNVELATIFKFNNQGALKTSGMEVVGNIVWLLPIAGMLGYAIHNGKGDHPDLGFWMLVISAFFSKVVIVLAVDEFGAGNFNAQVWLARMLTTFVATKGKITAKELGNELSGVFTTLACGTAAGAVYFGMMQSPRYV